MIFSSIGLRLLALGTALPVGGVAIPQAALARNGALEAADLGARSDGKMFLRELHTVDWANS